MLQMIDHPVKTINKNFNGLRIYVGDLNQIYLGEVNQKYFKVNNNLSVIDFKNSFLELGFLFWEFFCKILLNHQPRFLKKELLNSSKEKYLKILRRDCITFESNNFLITKRLF